MRTAVHGMSRIGPGRELKWALEAYWAGRASVADLHQAGATIRRDDWQLLAGAGVDFVPSNDFSLYDHVLDAAVAVGAVPERFGPPGRAVDLSRYFAMARGATLDDVAVAPFELTKWFDTNYHQLVPEVGRGTRFRAGPSKAIAEFEEAAAIGLSTGTVLLGPLTFLLRCAVPREFDRLALLDPLVEVYVELLARLDAAGVAWLSLEEPALVEDRSPAELAAFRAAYRRLGECSSRPKITVSTYFGHVGEAMGILAALPVEAIGLDFCRGKENLSLLEQAGGIGDRLLFAGVVDGRNVWVNDLEASLDILARAMPISVPSSMCSPTSTSTLPRSRRPARTWLSLLHSRPPATRAAWDLGSTTCTRRTSRPLPI